MLKTKQFVTDYILKNQILELTVFIKNVDIKLPKKELTFNLLYAKQHYGNWHMKLSRIQSDLIQSDLV